MFPDHVKVIGDGAFFSQLMQMKDGYTDGHQGQWFTTPEVTEATMKEVLSIRQIFFKRLKYFRDQEIFPVLGGGFPDPRAHQRRPGDGAGAGHRGEAGGGAAQVRPAPSCILSV